MMTREEFKLWLKEIFLSKKGDVIASRIELYKEEFSLLDRFIPTGRTMYEKIYCILNDLNNLPLCQVCGRPTFFISSTKGFRKFCSTKCSNSSPDTIKNKQKVYLEKYGVSHPSKSSEIQERKKHTFMKKYGVPNPSQAKKVQEKRNATFLERFGGNPMQSQEVKDKLKKTNMEKYGSSNPFSNQEVKEKIEKKVLDKYGVDHISHSPEIRKKTENTNMEKYGVSNPLKSEMIKRRIMETNLEKYGVVYPSQNEEIKKITSRNRLIKEFSRQQTKWTKAGIIFKDNQTYEGVCYPLRYEFECFFCNAIFSYSIDGGRIPKCPSCNPVTVSSCEHEIVEWLTSLNFTNDIRTSYRDLIPSGEIDIFLPEFNLAIEYDGIYWHSERSKGKGIDYHLSKTLSCQKKGVHLLHIFESEWKTKKDIVKSIILAQLGIFEKRIMARKCDIKEISSMESEVFLDANHIQGYHQSSLRYGLFFEGELVSCLCIGKSRYKKDSYEIIRYGTKINTTILGGLQKLWKKAKSCLEPGKQILSYVDLRYFLGRINEQIGLSLTYRNKPSYFYTKNYQTLENRMNYQKFKLSKKLSIYDPNLTEWENMQLNGYDRIWDCGTAVYSGTV
jgi:hypothetical protein